MNPIFPLTTPPTCRRCGHLSIRRIVKEDNDNGNADRPYFSCMDDCHPNNSEFVSWDDYEGIGADNPPCWCNGNFPSRKNKTNKEPRRYFYKCPIGRCKFYTWGGEVEEQDGLGYGYSGGGGGGSGAPVPAENGAYLKIEETKYYWNGAAGPSRPAMYARPAFNTQISQDSAYGSQTVGPSRHAGPQLGTRMDERDEWAPGPSEPTTHARPAFDTQMSRDSAYGSQDAGPSAHATLPAGARIDEIYEWATGPSGHAVHARQIETQVNRGETVASGPVVPTVSASPRGERQMEETRPNGVGAASSNGLAMHPHPSQSLQRQTEETPNISVVTAGVPVYTQIAGKSADISISSMEEGFGVKFGATSRRRCCGICAVM